jgi:hypothetical protein
MKTVKHDVGLLETIADFIDRNDEHLLRVALILCDNLAELLMYRKARRHLAEDEYWKRPPKYKKKDLLKWFASKLEMVFAETEWLSEDHAKFITFAHKLRNAAYHQNEYHRDIILPVVQTYFAILCDWYLNTVDRITSAPMRDGIDPFLERYGLTDTTSLFGEGLITITRRLSENRTGQVGELAATLSGNLTSRIDEIIGTEEERGLLEILGEDYGTTKSPPEEVLRHLLFRETLKGKICQSDEEFTRELQEMEKRYAAFQSPMTLDTLKQWRSDASDLAARVQAGQAMSEYDTIDRQFVEIEELVHQAVYEADEWVNMQT